MPSFDSKSSPLPFDAKAQAVIAQAVGAYHGTIRSIDSAVMGAQGWELGEYDGEQSRLDSIFGYLFDAASGWSWVCKVPVEQTGLIQRTVSEKAHVFHEASNMLGGYCEDILEGKRVLSPEVSNNLAYLFCAYLTQTRTLSLAGGFKPGNHFVVLLYRGQGADSDRSPAHRQSVVRPFALKGDPDTVLPADLLTQRCQEVVALDTLSHPEWLRGEIKD